MQTGMNVDHSTVMSCEYDPWIPLTWQANASGALTRADTHWFSYTGLTQGLAFGRGWRRCVHPDDLSETLERWRLATFTGERFERRHRLQGVDGQYRWFLERATPIKNKDRELIGWNVVSTDIDDACHAAWQEANLLAETLVETRVQRLLSEAGVGVLEFDPAGQLRFATREAQTALAASGESLSGKTIQEILPRLLSPNCLERISRPLPHAKSTFTERELGVVKSWVKFRCERPDAGLTLYFRSFNLEQSRPPLGLNTDAKSRATKH
jgi:PAS domain S-box-containing protein